MEVIVSILKTLYESLWASLVLAVLFSVISMCLEGISLEQKSYRELFRQWWVKIKTEGKFRHKFFFYIYAAMLLYKALLSRSIWEHPFEVVFAGWKMLTPNGEVDMQVVENVFIFIPFIILLFWAYGLEIIKGNTVWKCLFQALKITSIISLSIEVLQAVLHLGTAQISDLCYNVVGGLIGGMIYWCGYLIKKKRVEKEKKMI